MYGRCGALDHAAGIFFTSSSAPANLVSWNSMLAAFAQQGHPAALWLFSHMLLAGISPDAITLTSLLATCARHPALLKTGCSLYAAMLHGTDFAVPVSTQHCGCIVDLLARSGYLGYAERFITSMMPCAPDDIVWMSLVGACRNYGDWERGRRAAQRVMELNPAYVGAYILMSNMYAAQGRWDDAAGVRELMARRGLAKEAGWSSIEVRNKVHVFTAKDCSHPKSEAIYAELHRLALLLKGAGYVPNTSLVLQDVEEELKEQLLFCHSEKLAIAFGVVSSTKPRSTLRIIKNLRMCGDCHNAFKLLSSILEREIVVRDTKRFHHFLHGRCHCGDYW
ncbi:hypothetical protein SELMODRAFT_138073 [Selaginella moellendorffii]|uniref:DYW domain-containing protein n=2 Tax=Selaginella moellendorffii TaxID=88036 RepID=D8TEK1_SELML|nr:hypothetical protein SELMODRAFT_138073 [Selaginella moellendorffii]